MHSSASARPAAKPPGTLTPASTTRAPFASVWTAILSSSARVDVLVRQRAGAIVHSQVSHVSRT